MDQQEALQAYCAALSQERDQYLYQQAVQKSGAATRRMPAAERDRYLDSQAFQSTLYHLKRADKVYQALRRGELTLEYQQAEYELLLPLIQSELKHENEIVLPFLRSVQRCRITLGSAHKAIAQIEDHLPRKYLQAQMKRLTQDADRQVEHYLRAGDLSVLAKTEKKPGRVVERLMETTFQNGVTSGTVDAAYAPLSLGQALQEEIQKGLPRLAACGAVCMENGEKISAAVKAEISRTKYAVIGEVKKRFPPKRVRRLLTENASLKALQRQADAAAAQEKKLHTALLSAIPEHYKDLYPLARQMRRRFILHLGPPIQARPTKA